LTGAVAHIAVPPLAVKAIEDSENIEQLIPAALNLRDRYLGLRSWLAEYQKALDEEDEGQQLKYERLLREISRSLQVQYGAKDSGGSGLSLSTFFFKLDLSRSLVDKLRNSFGVRSALCDLVMTARGNKAIERLIAMFGEGKSLLGRDVLGALQSRYSAKGTASTP